MAIDQTVMREVLTEQLQAMWRQGFLDGMTAARDSVVPLSKLAGNMLTVAIGRLPAGAKPVADPVGEQVDG